MTAPHSSGGRTRAMRDGATIAGVVILVAGWVLVVVGWRGVTATTDLYAQVAYLLSGGVAGVALIGIGCVLLVVQTARWSDAVENQAWARLATQWRAGQPAAAPEAGS